MHPLAFCEYAHINRANECVETILPERGVPGEHYVAIYYGPLFPKEKGTPIAYPDYPYSVEVEIEGVTDHHFISPMSPVTCNWFPSWLTTSTRPCS